MGDTLCDFGDGDSLRGAALRFGQPRRGNLEKPQIRSHGEENTDDKQRRSSPNINEMDRH